MSLERSAIVAADFPLIAQTEGNVANVRVRNVGTIGGNLCFGEPHSDPGALLLAVRRHGDGSRRVRDADIPSCRVRPWPF